LFIKEAKIRCVLSPFSQKFFSRKRLTMDITDTTEKTRRNKNMFEVDFLKATAERAIKTFVQTLLALVGTDAAGILSVDLNASLQVAASAAFISVLTSFGSSSFGSTGPSLAGETTKQIVVKAAAKKK
jgi:hypothetical protein